MFIKNGTLQGLSANRCQNVTTPYKQTGSAKQLLFLLVLGGLGYGAFVAKNKGIISFDKTQQFVSQLTTEKTNTYANDSGFKGYGVQLMATKQLPQAKAVMDDFARDGYSAFVLSSRAKGRTLYKVRLGPYAHKPEAVAIKDKLVRRYPNNRYVKSSLVIYKPN